jgi:UDP-N-acetylglucosamine 1-carboxyvinyltransferase
MDQIVVHGGTPLRGTVRISGSKNAALPILAACILADGKVTLRNIPRLRDIVTMLKILRKLGVSSEWVDERTVVLEAKEHLRFTAPYEMVAMMRASVCVMGPLLARRKKARVSLPGGCVIGVRPIDLHLKGIEALGANVRITHGYIEAVSDKLRGANVYLGGPYGSTVLGTANVMAAAAFAEGTTVIESAACEPEVEDLANFLNAMGARITGQGTPRLTIEGVDRLEGVEYEIIPDRIEAATFIAAGAITGGEVTVTHMRSDHLGAVLDVFRRMGIEIETNGNEAHVRRSGALKPVDVATLTYPGFPTDAQAQAMALMTMADGISVITEKIYPDRFMHVAELNRLGARIRKEGPSAIVAGPSALSGAPVMASDLRASAALVLAGLVAEGYTEVNRVYHIDRGYEQIEKKLAAIGAKIERKK